MILVISLCKEKLHELEFVKPIEDILKNNFIRKHYLELTEDDFNKCDKIIICGTSLKDNKFLDDIEKFDWIKSIDKPLFGICAGFQLIGLIHGGKLKKHLEIGYFFENFDKSFLGLDGKQEVYHLHNNYVDFCEHFDLFSDGEIVQAIKHNNKQIYGTLFHPEVRNKKMILNFINL